MTPCTTCAHPTNRYDHLCPNCYYEGPESDNPQTIVEALTIEHEKYTCRCGESRTRVLILMCKGALFMQPGHPRTTYPTARNNRAFMVEHDPSKWYALCYNCHAAVNRRPPGRPKKYTDEERKWNRANAPKIYKANLLTNLLLSYGIKGKWPTCTMCDLPATRALYVGEFGKAPLGNHYWRCRGLALKDAKTDRYWHSQFLPYCAFHEVSNIGERNRQWKAKVAAHNAEAQAKSTRTFADLERLGLV